MPADRPHLLPVYNQPAHSPHLPACSRSRLPHLSAIIITTSISTPALHSSLHLIVVATTWFHSGQLAPGSPPGPPPSAPPFTHPICCNASVSDPHCLLLSHLLPGLALLPLPFRHPPSLPSLPAPSGLNPGIPCTIHLPSLVPWLPSRVSLLRPPTPFPLFPLSP
ncbi:WW domain-binding protein 11-like [Etheostoma spectabile]|uniref:WW domain-binding protein 11-like n=1 Tax=Etheostoma spectabile TaxID=54343 RepID=UPI0013AEE824|nr:WW domain-binding protein 11-like [Etheostoma spectabile]